jgi:hypothetical protein
MGSKLSISCNSSLRKVVSIPSSKARKRFFPRRLAGLKLTFPTSSALVLRELVIRSKKSATPDQSKLSAN